MILHSVKDLEQIPTRIVSLVPSQTELLHYLGLDAATIAITKFCVHPKKWRRSKIVIGGTKNIHIEQIRELQPDLVIANREENVKEQVEELAKDYPVWLTDVNNLDDAYGMIQDIGILTNTSQQAAALVEKIKIGFSELHLKDISLPAAYLIWRNPLMTIGGDTFINDMLNRCGLQNIFAGETRYPEITVGMLQNAGCKLLLLSSEPYPFKQMHLDELQASLPGTKILLVDGEIFSWYGSRLLKAPAYFKTLIAGVDSDG